MGCEIGGHGRERGWVIKSKDLQNCLMETYCKSFLKYMYMHIYQYMLIGFKLSYSAIMLW